MTPEAKAYCERMTQRIAELEQQVAALTMERESHFKQIAHYCEHLAATQAREAKMREALVDYDNQASEYDGRTSKELGDRIKSLLARPTDDSALMERLKEERERCKKECEGFTHRDDKEVAEAIAVAIGSMT